MPDADRDLLFGALALQLGFVTGEAFAAAVAARGRDRSRPLDRVLCDMGALTEPRRALLEPLVNEHLDAHGGDTEASLAAAGAPGAAAPDGPTAPWAGAGPASPRYRVVRPLARGGIGVVSVAVDAELHREVALKEIQPGQADDPVSRARFLLEAEVTGRLEHPGVVPVYGLGCGGDGRPYYAMRLVKGESLREASARFHAGAGGGGGLALRNLLARFVAVCYAVAYAHSRGVVHRDLKPANVMLGPYGETLVVDWGLAKLVGRDDPAGDASAEATLRPGSGSGVAETQAGAAVGTPAYMSPEQAEGRVGAVGVASDVYSLGATLYHLLTGRPPVEGADVGEVLRRVARGDVPQPRAVNPSVPRGLEAVCLKAMARDPAARYPSARAVAEEVEHWLADEPVAAWPEPWWGRAARWGRRHRPAVAGAAALLVTAVVGLAAGAALLQRANARTQRERDLARRNFATARRAVDDYLTRVGQNPVLKEQGLHDLRQELLEAALRYYREFLAQQGADPGLRAEAAAASARVGDIHRELGRLEESLAAYDQALDLALGLPDDPAVSALRLQTEGSRILALTLLHRYAEATAAFERAAAPWDDRRDAATGPLSPALARLYNAGAEAYAFAGSADRAIEPSLRALTLAEAYAERSPTDLEALHTLMTAYAAAVRRLILANRAEDAGPVAARGEARGEALVRAYPRDSEFRVFLSNLLTDTATLHRNRGDRATELRYVRRGVAAVDAFCRDNPRLLHPRLALVNNLTYQGLVEADLRDPAARATAERAVTLARDLLAQSNGLPRSRELLGNALLTLGKVRAAAGDLAGALAALRESAEALEGSREPAHLYNAACSLALASGLTDPAAPPAAEADRRRRDAERAIEVLRRAEAAGFRDISLLQHDPDLDAVRKREDFLATVRGLESRPAPKAP